MSDEVPDIEASDALGSDVADRMGNDGCCAHGRVTIGTDVSQPTHDDP